MNTIATPTTTRCRLPFPTDAPTHEQIVVEITDRQDILEVDERIAPGKSFAVDLVDVVTRWGGSDCTRTTWIGTRDARQSHGLVEYDGGTVSFPSLGDAVAHVMLNGFDPNFLGITEPMASLWRGLRRARHDRAFQRIEEPLDAWRQRAEAERAAIVDSDNAETLREAAAVHLVLDDTCQRLIDRDLEALLASGRPFDPEHNRYLDGAREYADEPA